MSRPKRMIIILAMLFALVLSSACAYLQRPEFGATPETERLARIERSPHYANGAFQNLIPTPTLAEGYSTSSIIASDLFSRAKDLRPAQAIPAIKTDLKALDVHRDTIIWLGHSSFFVLFAGKRILIDPVFSSYAAPVSFANRAFDGTNLYSVEDMPQIDLLLITHDHWDHLDYSTVRALEPKVQHALVALGVGAHLANWGYPRHKIHEAGWYDTLVVNDLKVHLVPARHYSGRLFTPNKTLWTGFVLESSAHRILFSGDTGYGPHFKEIAQRFGSFDLVALDTGQYDPRWPNIHMQPEEAAQAAEDLQAQALLPAHIGRFCISQHSWREPFERIVQASQNKHYHLQTPQIGEALHLDAQEQTFAAWWQQV